MQFHAFSQRIIIVDITSSVVTLGSPGFETLRIELQNGAHAALSLPKQRNKYYENIIISPSGIELTTFTFIARFYQDVSKLCLTVGTRDHCGFDTYYSIIPNFYF